MKFLIGLLLSIIFALDCNAQELKFFSSGSIFYERQINLYHLYSSQPQLLNEFKKNKFQFKKEIFQLDFNSNFTLYKSGEQSPENNKFSKIPFDDNTVFSNFGQNTKISEKNLYDKKYFISDSLKKYKWKLTEEKRNIAGYECRRANGILFDSIYVVVFFCEEIIVKGGPESFCGLPGMILGVALPQQHVTWFATKIVFKEIYINPIIIPSPSMGLNSNEFKKLIKSDLKINPFDLFTWYNIFSEI